MKYTAISRSKTENQINVLDEYDFTQDDDDIQDTIEEKLKEKVKRKNKMKDPLNRKRRAACTIINRIIKENITEEYCLKHTGVNKKELLKHLKIPLGKILRGFDYCEIQTVC